MATRMTGEGMQRMHNYLGDLASALNKYDVSDDWFADEIARTAKAAAVRVLARSLPDYRTYRNDY